MCLITVFLGWFSVIKKITEQPGFLVFAIQDFTKLNDLRTSERYGKPVSAVFIFYPVFYKKMFLLCHILMRSGIL